MDTLVSRRQLLARGLRTAATVAVAGAVAPVLPAAGKVCVDPKSMDTAPNTATPTRKSLNYVELAKKPEQSCAQCAFFQEADDDCGHCQVFSGPANPRGHCDSWAQ